MLNEFLFKKIEEEDAGNIWFQQDGATCPTAKTTLDVLLPVFEDRRTDVVWSPQSCDLTPLDYYLWGAVKDKSYADKPETIDALKDNIREAFSEIQLLTIDNVLINWTDRVGYCSLRKYSVVFFKAFSKKKVIWRTLYNVWWFIGHVRYRGNKAKSRKREG